MNITEQMLDELRRKIENKMSPKRFRHTAEVEKMAAYIGSIYAPEKIPVLRAAALLHDVTKEYSTEAHLKICGQNGISLDRDAMFAPKTLHARTAAALIPSEYPEFADDEIISAVRWHTTGRADMTLTEKIIYLADYIDMSRTFEDCVMLRDYFMGEIPEKLEGIEKEKHLRLTLIMSFDLTINALTYDGLPISKDTVEARNQLVCEELAAK